MTVALPLPNIPMDQSTSVRADKATGALQSALEEGGAGNEFASLLSELTTGTASSERPTDTLSGTDRQSRGDDKSDRASAPEASALDARTAAEAVATPAFIDPSWSMLLSGIASPPRSSTSTLTASDEGADRPPPSNISTIASSLLESAPSSESERGAPTSPISLGQALAAATRSGPDAARDGGAPQPEPALDEGASAPAQSASAQAESAAVPSIASESGIATTPKPEERSDERVRSPSRAGSIDAVRPEATESDSRFERQATSQSFVSAVHAASARPGRSAEETAPETISDVKIQSLETHLPVALSSIVVAQARSSFGIDETERPNVSVAIAPSSVAIDMQPGGAAAPTKLLTIELEPDSLGAVTVKMKMSRSGIDMQIRVDSAEALRALDASRDKLVDAMQSSGCTVDSCTIQVASSVIPTAASDGSQTMANGNGQGSASSEWAADRQENIGREGMNDDGRSGSRRDEARSGREETSRDVAPRRTGRVGDVYL